MDWVSAILLTLHRYVPSSDFSSPVMVSVDCMGEKWEFTLENIHVLYGNVNKVNAEEMCIQYRAEFPQVVHTKLFPTIYLSSGSCVCFNAI